MVHCNINGPTNKKKEWQERCCYCLVVDIFSQENMHDKLHQPNDRSYIFHFILIKYLHEGCYISISVKSTPLLYMKHRNKAILNNTMHLAMYFVYDKVYFVSLWQRHSRSTYIVSSL
ncbi:hypothetical protein PYW08_004675 [Mythimna loreyi]|uniref:Uncharacterized protein n=1 Tax=Mythimna loreyi TaxID=667449 RepID=A0ACC2QQ38_9NEOP|nr:hypothetical protein PYW08_004675 [Mythimna loreyi]